MRRACGTHLAQQPHHRGQARRKDGALVSQRPEAGVQHHAQLGEVARHKPARTWRSGALMCTGNTPPLAPHAPLPRAAPHPSSLKRATRSSRCACRCTRPLVYSSLNAAMTASMAAAAASAAASVADAIAGHVRCAVRGRTCTNCQVAGAPRVCVCARAVTERCEIGKFPISNFTPPPRPQPPNFNRRGRHQRGAARRGATARGARRSCGCRVSPHLQHVLRCVAPAWRRAGGPAAAGDTASPPLHAAAAGGGERGGGGRGRGRERGRRGVDAARRVPPTSQPGGRAGE